MNDSLSTIEFNSKTWINLYLLLNKSNMQYQLDLPNNQPTLICFLQLSQSLKPNLWITYSLNLKIIS